MQAEEELAQEDGEGASQAVPEDSGDERGRAAEREREVNGEGGAVPQDQGASAVHQEGASETHQVTMHI